MIKTSIVLRNEPFGGIYFNQKNGKMALVDREGFNCILKYLSNENLTYSQNAFINSFFEEDGIDIINFLYKPFKTAHVETPIKATSPILVNIALNNYCNLNCMFCYALNDKETRKINLSLDVFDYLLNELRKNRVLQVALGGGEPTLHPNFVQILRKLRIEGNIIPNYTTNGTNLTHSILRATKKYCGAVAVSYSRDREKELFNAVQKLRRYNIQTHLNLIMFKSQIPYLAEIVKKFVKLGISNIILLLFKPIGRATNLRYEIPNLNDIARLNRELLKIYIFQKQYKFSLSIDACSSFIFRNFEIQSTSIGPCTSAFYSACIDYNLNMRPCSIMQQYKEIHLKQVSLKEAWNSKEFEEFRQKFAQLRYEDCKTCKHLIYCLGGCPIMPEIVFCEKRGG